MNTLEVNEIKVGEYTLCRAPDGKLWICRDGGEAMECNSKTELGLVSLVEAFWEANF